MYKILRTGAIVSLTALSLVGCATVFCQILLSHVCTRIEPRERLNMSHVCTLELSGTSSTIELLNVVWSWWLFHGCIGDSVGSSFESEHAAMMHCAVNDRSGHLLVSEYGAPA